MRRIERSLEVLVGSVVDRDLLRHALDAGEKLYSLGSAETMINYLKNQYGLELAKHKKEGRRNTFYFTANKGKVRLIDIILKISDYLNCGFSEVYPSDFTSLDPPGVSCAAIKPKFYPDGLKEVNIRITCNRENYEEEEGASKRYFEYVDELMEQRKVTS